MDPITILRAILLIVLIVVCVALVVVLVEAKKTVAGARTAIDDLKKQVEPTLQNAQKITESIQPAVDRVDPLVERAQLTIDAANLELMRVDQILEDVSNITDTASNAVDTVDTITSAPVSLVTNVTGKIRDRLKPKEASDETKRLEKQRVAAAQALEDLKSEEKKLGQDGKSAVKGSIPGEGAATPSGRHAAKETEAQAPADTAAATVEAAEEMRTEAYFTYEEGAADEGASASATKE